MKDDSKRTVQIDVSNLEPDLDLQLIVTCDSSFVTGYGLLADQNPATEEISKLDIASYKCGDKLRISQNKFGAVVLI